MADLLYTTDPINDGVTVPETDPTLITTPTPTLPTILTSPFISAAELSTHIYGAAVGVITDGDITILPQAIAAATNEAMGYMSRYDYVTILSQKGAARDPILLQYIKDLSLWHFMTLSNPNVDYEAALNRYKMAIRWLEKVQDGRFIPAGWPVATPVFLSTQWHVKSRDKRSNNY